MDWNTGYFVGIKAFQIFVPIQLSYKRDQLLIMVGDGERDACFSYWVIAYDAGRPAALARHWQETLEFETMEFLSKAPLVYQIREPGHFGQTLRNYINRVFEQPRTNIIQTNSFVSFKFSQMSFNKKFVNVRKGKSDFRLGFLT